MVIKNLKAIIPSVQKATMSVAQTGTRTAPSSTSNASMSSGRSQAAANARNPVKAKSILVGQSPAQKPNALKSNSNSEYCDPLLLFNVIVNRLTRSQFQRNVSVRLFASRYPLSVPGGFPPIAGRGGRAHTSCTFPSLDVKQSYLKKPCHR
jgi:hypothetical protein